MQCSYDAIARNTTKNYQSSTTNSQVANKFFQVSNGVLEDPHTMSSTTFASEATTFESALTSLFSGPPETTEADLAKFFTPTFIQRDDETTRDFSAFVAHIKWLRGILPPGSVTLKITQFLRDGNQFADRHSSTMKMPDGKVGAAETFMFGEVAEDGRIEWVVETVKRK